MSRYARITRILAIVGLSGFVTFAGVYAVGARINTTKSIPLGLYWISDADVNKNSYVIFCPPAEPIFLEAKKRGYLTTGFCEGELGYMMKKVLAAKGDSVSFEQEGVRVNGELLPLTARATTDKHGRDMLTPQSGVQVLNDDELLVMSDVNPKSFDSRYFGAVNRKQIKSVITPVITW